MDSFFASMGSHDTQTLQEMLDMDADSDMNEIFSFDLHKLPSINLDDDSLGAPVNNVWLTPQDGNSRLGGDFNFGSELNVAETRMVCPNSVMPVTLIEVPYDKPPPKQEISIRSLKPLAPVEKVSKITTSNVRHSSPVPASEANDLFNGKIFIKKEEFEDNEDQVDSYRAPTSFKNLTFGNKLKVEDSPRSMTNGGKRNVQSIRTLTGKRRISQNNTSDLNLVTSAFPKPAYSYSCLIAMALKNSPSGSLPVSEIYNFMCQHFPYFKTAPSGWKNSVRHNLSLNKCFEKIEKPATNGSQRKGCLWAMNPNKVNKMDEEVQKWSKKDKSAIRKSMIYPENLDALERGELVVRHDIKMEYASDDEQWDGNIRVDDVTTEDDDEQDDDDEEDMDEEDVKFWKKAGGNILRLSADDDYPNAADDDGESNLSLTDLGIDFTDSIYSNDSNKVNVQVKVSTSPIGFKQLLPGAYTVNANGTSAPSPKRLKTLGSISGNYVCKPLSSANIQRKSPIRHTVLSALDADDL